MTAAVRRTRGDGGLTLVEVLVTVVILGIAFVTVVGGMAVSIAGSDVHRKQATSQTVLRNLAEYMKAADYDTSCPADYSPALASFSSEVGSPSTEPHSVSPRSAGVSYTVELFGPVEIWDPTGAFTPSTAGCADAGLQRVTLRVQSMARPELAPEELVVVKRVP